MIASMPAQPRTPSAGCTPTAGGDRRSGFTLVELLVVLLIVGMLAAILTPVVMQSLAKARNAAIKAEIDMLHMAIMNYKNEYGSFPPCVDVTPVKTGLHDKHLQRLFPRAASFPVKSDFQSPSFTLEPGTAIAYWLWGYSNSPTTPTSGDLTSLYDFDKSRLPTAASKFTGFYHSPSKPSAFFYYIDSANYYFNDTSGKEWPRMGVHFDPSTAPLHAADMTRTWGEDGLAPTSPPSRNATLDSAGGYTEDSNQNGVLDYGEPFNKDTFQILHPGRDEVLFTDDDLSNFWPGTRKEYLDSLNN